MKTAVLALALLLAVTRCKCQPELTPPPDAWEKSGLTGLEVHALSRPQGGIPIYAGTNNGGVFRSVDDGKNWEDMSITSATCSSCGKQTAAVTCFGRRAADNTVLVGTRIGLLREDHTGNAGALWSHVVSAPSAAVLALAQKDGAIFLATDPILYRSLDDGASWEPIAPALSHVNALAVNTHTGTVYAGNDFGVHTSVDNGDTWITAKTGSMLTGPIYSLNGFSISTTNEYFYAGGRGKIYGKGQNWYEACCDTDISIGPNIQFTAITTRAEGTGGVHTRFAGTDTRGALVSYALAGNKWQDKKQGIDPTVYSLLTTGMNSILAGTRNGVYRYR